MGRPQGRSQGLLSQVDPLTADETNRARVGAVSRAKMRIHLLAVGTRMPAWIQQGYREYARRLRGGWSLELVEIPSPRRSKSTDVARSVEKEGERMLAAIPRNACVVALDEAGKALSTALLVDHIGHWRAQGQDLALLVGGADGLAPGCLKRAQMRWSLSALTLPHGLVRVLVAEQLYRAWSLTNRHPYHRE